METYLFDRLASSPFGQGSELEDKSPSLGLVKEVVRISGLMLG